MLFPTGTMGAAWGNQHWGIPYMALPCMKSWTWLNDLGADFFFWPAQLLLLQNCSLTVSLSSRVCSSAYVIRWFGKFSSIPLFHTNSKWSTCLKLGVWNTSKDFNNDSISMQKPSNATQPDVAASSMPAAVFFFHRSLPCAPASS